MAGRFGPDRTTSISIEEVTQRPTKREIKREDLIIYVAAGAIAVMIGLAVAIAFMWNAGP